MNIRRKTMKFAFGFGFSLNSDSYGPSVSRARAYESFCFYVFVIAMEVCTNASKIWDSLCNTICTSYFSYSLSLHICICMFMCVCLYRVFAAMTYNIVSNHTLTYTMYCRISYERCLKS